MSATLVDFAHQQWFAVCAQGVIARHGGYAVHEDGAWQWRSAPFVNAWRVIVDGDRWWVDTPGVLWEHADGVWTPRRADARLEQLLACPLSPPPTVFAEVIAREREVWRHTGDRWRVVATAPQLPAPGTAFRAAAGDGRGGAWIVDDAGALLHHDGTQLELVRAGSITTWQRHVYPDPDPDDYSDPVSVAAVSAAGTTATYRFYNHGRTASHGELAVVDRGGTVREQRRIGDWEHSAGPILGFVGDELAVVAWDRIDGGIAPLEPSIVDAADNELRFTVAGREFAAPIFVPGPPLERPVDTVAVNRETWTIEDGALVIACEGARFVPDLGARVVALFPRPLDLTPLVVDVYGGLHVLDGAALVSTPLEPAIECLIAARRGTSLFIASTRTMVWLSVPHPSVPAAITEVAAIRARLAGSVAVVRVAEAAQPRAEVASQLAGWRRCGRSEAGIALGALLAGSDDAPGPADHVALATGVLAGCDAATDFYVLGARGWAAVGGDRSLVIRAR